MISFLLSALIISATPQEHQVENVFNPKIVEVTILERGRGNNGSSIKLSPTVSGGLDGIRLITLIVPNNADGVSKLNNTLKSKERLSPISIGPNRNFLVYSVPFEDLQDEAKLKELAKENKTVQMYSMFRTERLRVPVIVNGKVFVNVNLLEKNKLKNFAEQHKLELLDHIENSVLGAYFLRVTDESDLLDVFAILESLSKEDWVAVSRLDFPLLPLR